MDFRLSEEQNLLQSSARRFCEQEYRAAADGRPAARSDGLDARRWQAIAEQGWIGCALASEDRTAALAEIDTAILMEEFGRAAVREPFLGCAILSTRVICEGVAPEQKALLEAVCEGRTIATLAHGEGDAWADTRHVRAIATDSHGEFSIKGRKSLVSGGAGAQLFLVSARTEGGAGGANDVRLFAVPRNTPGLQIESYELFDGSLTSDLSLDGVRVPASAALNFERPTLDVIEDAIDSGIVALCAEAVGAMEAVVNLTREHLKNRKQYGVALSTFQALQHRVADMLTELELSRSILHSALARDRYPTRARRRAEVAAAKVQIGTAGAFVGAHGIQLHGAMGVSDEYPVGRYFKRLKIIDSLFGNADYHLERLAATSYGSTTEPGE